MDSHDFISQWDLGSESRHPQKYISEGKERAHGRILNIETKD